MTCVLVLLKLTHPHTPNHQHIHRLLSRAADRQENR